MRLLLVDSWWGVWLALFGLLAQGIFMARMLVQWVASERARASVVPVSFWWLSLAGSVLLLAYGALREDVVIISAQLFGFIVYGRNLWLIRGTRRIEHSAAGPRGPRA
ncbi:lipid A biosynthesis protein [Paroceanicella profunda]|uniref:Lipid A biosynthesis protein n=2 Tax=Paroceanicella profunda TaxID=2579971 RepID=A0A5B8FXB4_9RHOB|nr:lipid A biosynthesis protein [Paroceanicella profunda]